jgi:hypothetical protein
MRPIRTIATAPATQPPASTAAPTPTTTAPTVAVAGAAALQVTGVRSHRPFRVLVLAGNGNHITHLVIDIAH